MKGIKFTVALMLAVLTFITLVAVGQSSPKEVNLVFSYFTGNGEDGLHLAYSHDGYTWTALNEGKSFLTPTAGKDKLMRDPSILQGPDGTFHMVWTVSWGERGIGYAHSTDLIHWSEQQYVPVMEHESETKNTWAPELFYDHRQKEFLIFWASTIPGRFEKGNEQKYNHRIYYTSTKDFKKFTATRLFYDHNFSVIDAAISKAGKQYIMFLKDETDKPFTPEKNIRIATAKKAKGPYTAPSKPITGDYWAEGPTPIKVNDKWFIYFDKYTKHKYGVVTSTDLKDWTDESDKLTMPSGIRHGTAFFVSDEVLNTLKTYHE